MRNLVTEKAFTGRLGVQSSDKTTRPNPVSKALYARHKQSLVEWLVEMAS